MNVTEPEYEPVVAVGVTVHTLCLSLSCVTVAKASKLESVIAV